MDAAERLCKKALAVLLRDGLLLKADAERPSVTTLAAGKPIRGSWWGHPKGGEIFNACGLLADHPDVILVKLIDGKDTFVHRRRWPEVLAAATDPAPARRRGLSSAAVAVLAQVEKAGALDVAALTLPAKDRLAAVRELEKRLLLRAEEYHTPSGAHAKRLESWRRWAKRARVCL